MVKLLLNLLKVDFIKNWLNEFNCIARDIDTINYFKKTFYREIALYVVLVTILYLI